MFFFFLVVEWGGGGFFNKNINSLMLAVSAMCLVGYLPPHIQRALVE